LALPNFTTLAGIMLAPVAAFFAGGLLLAHRTRPRRHTHFY
jgi:hypothetical protein